MRLIHPPATSPWAVVAAIVGAFTLWLHTVAFDSHEVDALVRVAKALETVRHPARTWGALALLVEVQLPDDDYGALTRNIERARRNSVIGRDEKQSFGAKILVDGSAHAAQIRLKGDWTDHLDGDFAALRVKLRGDDRVFGMRSFNLQPPVTRNGAFEWLYMRACRDEGVLAPRHEFVTMALQDRPPLPYLLIEHFSKELLEHQKRREGVILKFDEGNYFASRAAGTPEESVTWETATVSAFGESHIAASRGLAEQRAAATAKFEAFRRGHVVPSETFKVEPIAHLIALADLFGAGHALVWHNLRFYYDPVHGRFEPIAWDGNAGQWSYAETPPSHAAIVGLLLADPKIQRAYNRALWRMTLPGYVDEILARDGSGLAERQAYLRRNDPTPSDPAEVSVASTLHENARWFRSQLEVRAGAHAWRAQSPGGSWQIWVENRTPFGLELQAIDAEAVESDRSSSVAQSTANWISPHTRPQVHRGEAAGLARFHLPDLGGPPRHLSVRLAGVIDAPSQRIPILPLPDASAAKRLDERVIRAGELIREENTLAWAIPEPAPIAVPDGWTEWDHDGVHWVVAAAGSSDLEDDLILPDGVGLRIDAGSTLRFGPQAVLVVRGPLDFRGRPDAPVVLRARDEPWGGLVVLSAQRRSRLHHVRIAGVAPTDGRPGPSRQGWFQTGGVVFADSDLEASHLELLDFATEDALNVVSAHLLLRDSLFQRVASDAFDGDFVTGRIERTEVRDGGGDAFDFSGSRVTLSRLTSDGVHDKAVSVGEASEVVLHGLRARAGRFALVAKDGSSLTASEVLVDDIWVAAAAYTKKREFGSATLAVTDLRLDGQSFASLAQTDSLVTVDGRRMPARSFDAADLYED